MSSKKNPPKNKLTNIALIVDDNETLNKIPIAWIKLPEYQPRQYFDEKKLEELAKTIKAQGISQPLVVRKVIRKNQYELVAGGRRYRAAKIAALKEVPVTIRELSEEEALEIAIVENLQREDLNPVEETESILRLLAQRLKIQVEEVSPLIHHARKQTQGRLAHNVMSLEKLEVIQEVFSSLGLMELESFASNRLPLLNLPEDILAILREGKLDYTKAIAIARVKDEQRRTLILETAIAEKLSLSRIRELVQAEREPRHNSPLQSRFETAYKKVKNTKELWKNPQKKKQLEKLLVSLEKLLEK